MKKTLVGLLLFSNICVLSHAQTSEQLKAYSASVKSLEDFNEIQRKAGMPGMDVPSFEEWQKSEENKKLFPDVSVARREDPRIRWERKMEEIRPQFRELTPVKNKVVFAHSIKAIEEKERLFEAASKAYEKQSEIERNLDEIAAIYNIQRTMENAEGKTRVLAGEQDGYPVWLESYNQIAAAGISADELWPTNSAPWPSSSTGRNLTGAGVVLGMWEVGGAVNTNHQEFYGRVLQMDTSVNLSDHASGVAGTMVANGNYISLSGVSTGELARGVAFDAYVDAYDHQRFNEEIADASAGTVNSVGLRVSNHSWGLATAWDARIVDYYYYDGNWYEDGKPRLVWNNNPNWVEDRNCGYYSSTSTGTGCAEVDALMATQAPRHLLVCAAGNSRFYGPQELPNFYFYPYQGHWALVYPSAGDKDWSLGDGDTYGFDTVMAPGTAKNVLTVGSVKDVYHDEGGQLTWGYADNSIINVSDFSSCGPTDDGRIKPDVVAVGEADLSIRSYGIVTPASGINYSYTNYTGTSFSAPSVTGGLGLSLERRTQLFPDLEPETDDLLNSSLKALAIHAADDVLNTGPDYLTGWGLFNAVSAVEQIELDAQHGRGTHIKELELDVSETNSWTVYLDGSAFKATIAWSDLPGAITSGSVDDSTPMLVNNLDVWVENEEGTQVYEPWVLNPDLQLERESVRNTPATTGYDNVNNVEQVEISSPTPGYYKIYVAHAGGISGGQSPSTQTVSVLSSGDIPLSPEITEFEQSPTNGTFLLSVECDPGAHMLVESCADLTSETWQTNGTFTAGGNKNSVFVTSSSDIHFWRVRRETGSD